MHHLQAVNRRRDADLPGLELECQIERVMARLMQIAAMEPEILLLGGFPHIALLAFRLAALSDSA